MLDMNPVNFYLGMGLMLMIGFAAGYLVARMMSARDVGKLEPADRPSDCMGRVGPGHPAYVATIDN